VKRSLDYKVRSGEWVAQAPFGYKNIRDPSTGKSMVVLDDDNAHLVRRFFVEYATGAYSLAELVAHANSWGLRSRKGCIVRRQYMHKVIKNPFYYGVMIVKGNRHAHVYEPLITKDIFDKCQQVHQGRGRKQTVATGKHPYLYRGVFRCGFTGRLISCDIKKRRYTYLIATNPADISQRVYVREEKISAYIEKKLKAIEISDAQFTVLAAHIKHSMKNYAKNEEQRVAKLHSDRDDVQAQLDKLTDLLIKDRITQDTYDRKYTLLSMRYSDLIIAIVENDSRDVNELEKAMITMIYICKNAYNVFKSSKTPLKHLLLKTLFSNCELNGENPHCVMVRPLCVMLRGVRCLEWQGL
jgi:site-specific DNA recombinase